MKGKKEDPGNNRLVSLNLIPGKAIGQFILETISRHKKDRKVIGSNQHRFTKGMSCWTNLITLYHEMPGSLLLPSASFSFPCKNNFHAHYIP